jgi:hypothetical protein
LRAIFQKFKQIHYDDVERIFRKYTRKNLNELYNYSHITNFIQRYNLVFKIDDKGLISLTNAEELRKAMLSFDLPIKPDGKYFEVLNSNASRSTKEPSGSKKKSKDTVSMLIDDSILEDEEIIEILDD